MEATATLTTIDTETLYRKLTSNHNTILINALDQEAFISKHIPGSINLPTENAEIAKNILPYMDAEIVVYCANAECTASPQLAQKLEEMGYTNVSDFEEGLSGWKSAGYEFTGNDV